MPNSEPDVRLILDYAKKELVELQGLYVGAARVGNEIPDPVKLRIKSFLENLKSCLDYVAHDIRAKYHPDAKKANDPRAKVNFPFAETDAAFATVVRDKVCPDLDKNCPALYCYLQSLNYSRPQNAWLRNHLKS